MKRRTFIGSCAASVGLWLALAFAITRFSYIRADFEIPTGFRAVVTWVWHRFAPDYRPDALDMEDAAALALFIVAHVVSALVITPLSVFGWRRMCASIR